MRIFRGDFAFFYHSLASIIIDPYRSGINGASPVGRFHSMGEDAIAINPFAFDDVAYRIVYDYAIPVVIEVHDIRAMV